jgi:uncharacterized protein (TIGR02266 family)
MSEAFLGRPEVNPRAGRCDLDVEVALVGGGAAISGRTKNLGTGGVFVATTELRPVGDRLALMFMLPGVPEPISVGTEVRWTRDSPPPDQPGAVPGMGLRFVDLPDESSTAIASFLEECERQRRERTRARKPK